MKVIWTKFALDALHDIYDYYKNKVSVLIANNIKESIFLYTSNEPNHSKYKIEIK